MPELLRFKTDDFLFTVKAASIENRCKTLTRTLATRQVGPSEYDVKVNPKLKLNEPPRFFWDGPYSAIDADTELNNCAPINLGSPIFFENTLYQFEWIFLREIETAQLNHRSKRICYAFIFTLSEDG